MAGRGEKSGSKSCWYSSLNRKNFISRIPTLSWCFIHKLKPGWNVRILTDSSTTENYYSTASSKLKIWVKLKRVFNKTQKTLTLACSKDAPYGYIFLVYQTLHENDRISCFSNDNNRYFKKLPFFNGRYAIGVPWSESCPYKTSYTCLPPPPPQPGGLTKSQCIYLNVDNTVL